eukprot:464789-Hanusia_phi.AAC.1
MIPAARPRSPIRIIGEGLRVNRWRRVRVKFRHPGVHRGPGGPAARRPGNLTVLRARPGLPAAIIRR